MSPWLGVHYRSILGLLAHSSRSVRILVTRPTGFSFGRGSLRVVSVRQADEAVFIVLAYEQYGSFPRRKKG